MDHEIIDNDTGELLPAQSTEVSPAIAAEINQQVATAKRYPRRRDQEISTEIMSRATLNEEIASECMYAVNRGGKQITGPSVRFAEIIRASFGNIRVATRFVGIDASDPDRQAVVVEAVCLDVQTNQGEVVFERRSIMTSAKGGKKPVPYGADMTSIAISAARSIARRNAILAVVPKSIWIEGYHRAVKVLQGEANMLSARRAQVFDAFTKIGVPHASVFAALGLKSIEDITIEHMPQLIGFLTAIKDGENPDSVLGRTPMTAASDHEKVANPLADGAAPQEGAGGQGPPRDGEGEKPEAPPEKPKPKKADKIETGKQPSPLDDIKTPEDYEAHANAWIDAATDVELARAQWSRERTKRTELGVMEDMLIRINKRYNDKIKELQRKAAA